MKEVRQIIKFYDRIKTKGLNMAIASVVDIKESTYRRIGARMVVCENGEWTGGVSGGRLEGDVLEKSRVAIFKTYPSHVIYNTMNEIEKPIGSGLGCNGIIKVLFNPIDFKNDNNEIEQLRNIYNSNKACILLKTINDLNNKNVGVAKIYDPNRLSNPFNKKLKDKIEEVRIKRRPQIIDDPFEENDKISILVEYIKPETKLVIIGDNYDVLALTSFVKELGWEIHLVCQKRKTSQVLLDQAEKIYAYEEIDDIVFDEFTAVILMTHDFELDKKLLPKIIDKNPSYLGMLGPKKRKEKMFAQLGNISDHNKNIIFSPIGLDIGAETPEEIAISILAEILAAFRNRDGHFLKTRTKTIHHRYL